MDIWTAMKAHYLTPLFQPKSVAVIGASETPESVGSRVFRNLLDAPFKGRIYGVNLRHPTVYGERVYARLRDLPEREIDLAVIATAARTLPQLLRECGEHGVKTALVLSRDFVAVDSHNRALLNEAMQEAQRYGLRVLGPNLLGLMRPDIGLIAANYQGRVKPGNLALLSQSSSVASAVLDWAEAHEVGFSNVVSLGAAADVNFGEILDYLSQDSRTHGILLYLEDVGEARGFMSALRAAARTKPVVTLKVGRYAEPGVSSTAARTHSERLIGRDDAFDAAMRRAGVLRVSTMVQMSIAARMLAANYRVRGRRLAVISNGYGVGRMAVDRARELQVELPRLDPATIARLDAVLPPIGSHDNPVDILGDAPPDRFVAATEACLADPQIDGVMVLLTPQAGTDDLLTAERMITLRDQTDKLLLLVWLGDKKIALSRKRLDRAKMAYFTAPEHAVEAFASLAAYAHIQLLSLQTPGPLASRDAPDVAAARAAIRRALDAGRATLDARETMTVLEAFHIPFAASQTVRTVDEAVAAAVKLGLPVALKIDADGVLHKSEVEGVLLDLHTLDAVAAAATQLLVESAKRGLNLQGLVVQKMHSRRHGRELMIGAARDAVFGPLILFGAGGEAVELFDDVAVTLPPLNDVIAHSLIRRSKIARALGPYRNHPAANMEAVKEVLLRLSEMVCELPELQEIDLNPVVVDEHGAVAVDAGMTVAPLPAKFRRYSHMAIHPYPSHLVREGQLRDGLAYTLRPIRPEDAEMEQRFVREELSEQSRFNRFMGTVKQLTKPLLVRLTQLDYAREMALIAVAGEQMLGVARFSVNPDFDSCEFAIAIGDRWQGRGLGNQLMNALFEAARGMELTTMEGDILASNSPMLGLMKKLGFDIRPHPDDPQLKWVVKRL
ncbi:bifunctional acetate--CoA ligase family protein/GNAT family N-acetyltransferase [Chitinimonas lacunae]|uniref:GNAT family N-acetyltransferase n=1 Tax=Chitinimonas lacunae TaxID=1963018 RepID=A0ABV8MS22_9NEIS